MSALVREKRLVYPVEVLRELEREADPSAPDQQFAWAREHEAEASAWQSTLLELKDVLAKVPKVLYRKQG